MNEKFAFSSSDVDYLKSINFRGNVINLKKGDILYQNNDLAVSFYLVLKGELELSNINKINDRISIVKQNAFFGIEDIFIKNVRNEDCVALTDSVLVEIFLRPDTKIPDKKVEVQKLSEAPAEYEIRRENYKGPIHEVIKQTNYKDIAMVALLLQRCNFTQAANFKEYIFKLVDQGALKIIVDLQHCKILDSTFLGVLVAAQKKLYRNGGELVLVCNQEIYSWLFVVTRMDKVFSICTDIDTAINKFG